MSNDHRSRLPPGQPPVPPWHPLLLAAPPPGGFGGAAGGFGAPQPFVAPRPFVPTPPLSTTLRNVTRILALVVGIPALILVVAVIVRFERQTKRDLVVFDNRLDTPAEVVVDGKTVETLEPHPTFSPVVTLPEGAKKIVVTSNGAVVSEVTLAIRPRGKGEAHGYRGLYVIGPASEYAIAKVPYYAETPDKPEPPALQPVPRTRPLAELPRELESFEMSIDEPFLESEKVTSDAKVVWRTHLCTVDRSKTPIRVGCSGFRGRR